MKVVSRNQTRFVCFLKILVDIAGFVYIIDQKITVNI